MPEAGGDGLEVATDRCLVRLVLQPVAGQGPELTTAIRRAMSDALKRAARDAVVYAVSIESAGAESFCAGRGAAELARLAGLALPALAKDLADDAFAAWHLDRFVKPSVAMVTGGVTGSGAAIVLPATHRIGTDAFSFRMPDPRMGPPPDCGVAHWLAQLPDRLGVWLALTGQPLDRAAALRLGMLTHAIPAGELPAIRTALADAEPVDAVLDARSEDPGPAVDWPRTAMADCFDASSVAEIIARLGRVRGSARDWAQSTAARLRPLSGDARVEAILALLASLRGLDLKAALAREHAAMLEALTADKDKVGAALAAAGAIDLPVLYEPPSVLG